MPGMDEEANVAHSQGERVASIVKTVVTGAVVIVL
jgi:hypothetical protein